MSPGLAQRASHWRDVVTLLVSRDFRGRYKHTRVGIAWSVANPVMFLLIFYFVFNRVIDLQIPRYATFVFIGILAWNWTQSALVQATSSISSNPGLVGQPGFPVGALPAVAVTSALLNLLIALPLLLLLAWIEGANLGFALVSLPLVLAVQFLFILAAAYVLAAVNVGLRDVEQIVPIALQLGYYITPIFYALALVPERYRPFFYLNPMTSIVESYRRVVIDGVWPDWGLLGALSLGSLVLLMFGLRYFEHSRYRFLEEL